METFTTAQSKLDHIAETKKQVETLLRSRRAEFCGDYVPDDMEHEEFEHQMSCVAEAIDESYWHDTKTLRIQARNEASREELEYIRDNQTQPIVPAFLLRSTHA